MRRVRLFIGFGALGAISACVASPLSGAHDLVHVLVVALTFGLAPLLAAGAYEAVRHQRLARGMTRLAYRGTLAGQAVEFVPGLSGACVAGLWSPRIFCGDDLSARLDEDELRAVMLHERHHQRDLAPLRIVALSAVAALIGRSVSGRDWLERKKALIEIAADRYALQQGVNRPTLASSLLKLSAGRGPAWALGFTTALDLRVQALLGEPTGLDLDRRVGGTVPALLFVAACIVVYLT